MDNYEDENEFNPTQIQKLAQGAVEAAVGSDQITYQKDKVNKWCQDIIETSIIELAKLSKQFKYAVTCIIVQNNGSGLQTAATAYWDTKNDGLMSVQHYSPTFHCILTIFCMAISDTH